MMWMEKGQTFGVRKRQHVGFSSGGRKDPNHTAGTQDVSAEHSTASKAQPPVSMRSGLCVAPGVQKMKPPNGVTGSLQTILTGVLFVFLTFAQSSSAHRVLKESCPEVIKILTARVSYCRQKDQEKYRS